MDYIFYTRESDFAFPAASASSLPRARHRRYDVTTGMLEGGGGGTGVEARRTRAKIDAAVFHWRVSMRRSAGAY